MLTVVVVAYTIKQIYYDVCVNSSLMSLVYETVTCRFVLQCFFVI